MKFGLSKNEYEYILQNVVTPLEEQGAQVFCYGSRARGDHRPFSDLDLMVESKENLSFLIGELKEKLVESDFPYKVDLVSLSDFASSYRPGYEQDKVHFYL